MYENKAASEISNREREIIKLRAEIAGLKQEAGSEDLQVENARLRDELTREKTKVDALLGDCGSTPFERVQAALAEMSDSEKSEFAAKVLESNDQELIAAVANGEITVSSTTAADIKARLARQYADQVEREARWRKAPVGINSSSGKN